MVDCKKILADKLVTIQSLAAAAHSAIHALRRICAPRSASARHPQAFQRHDSPRRGSQGSGSCSPGLDNHLSCSVLANFYPADAPIFLLEAKVRRQLTLADWSLSEASVCRVFEQHQDCSLLKA